MYSQSAVVEATPSTLLHPPTQLSKSHLNDVMALQDVILQNLSPDHKNFVIPKSRDEFAARMTDRGIMHGIFDHATGTPKLIAYSTLAFPNDFWPVADMVLSPHAVPAKPTELAVSQSKVVHPEYRHMRLSRQLTAAQMEVCHNRGRKHIMAEIAAANPESLTGLLRKGFEVFTATIDPEDGCPLLYVIKDTAKPEIAPKETALDIDPVKEFKALKKLLKHGYRGHTTLRTKGTDGYRLLLSPPSP